MPPKTTKVQPVRVESSKSARGKSGAKKITDEPLPPISGDAKDQAGNGEVNNERVIHENEIYNEYDLDGHRLESPEPTTRWGKFRRRVRHWWKDSTLKARKEECMKQFHEWRVSVLLVKDECQRTASLLTAEEGMSRSLTSPGFLKEINGNNSSGCRRRQRSSRVSVV
ncbi:hypothetical protein TCAL_16105 [Tigriopus californicus]|uniref:Uncharacterized protein n=1 Tax=Tigriopus californicus TaxID=6832 RepID=A0A553PNB8_TIGCA|nr:hypothetical protein TCAL_16105 [Tigriopus californicus]